jgi:phosphoglycolate phosphatase-like HAD superfamily hydrolase
MSKEAVLFDFSGTLIEPLYESWREANNRIMAVYDAPKMDLPTFKQLGFGTDVAKMLDHQGLDPSLAGHIEAVRNVVYNTIIAEQVRWMKGAVELVEAVRSKQVLTGLVTHERHINLKAMQPRLQHESLFDVVIAKDDMELPGGDKLYKPNKHGLELAANRLGIPLSATRYAGDLNVDMGMAKNAGVPGILIEGQDTTDDARELATHIYSSLDECRARMDEWISSNL